ncbi:hypothetical protein CEJ87_10505 [Caldifermentibacillus hisashii]|nr:hypothetical protein CEJ87_10505 [Caldifermentibacillus hisashii]
MSVSRLKKTTREDLVARKMSFQPKKDDENGFRRQKRAFPGSKRRRERVSSPPKKRSFPSKKDDEIKREFLAQN